MLISHSLSPAWRSFPWVDFPSPLLLGERGEPWDTLSGGLPLAAPTLPGVASIVATQAFSAGAEWPVRHAREPQNLPGPRSPLPIPQGLPRVPPHLAFLEWHRGQTRSVLRRSTPTAESGSTPSHSKSLSNDSASRMLESSGTRYHQHAVPTPEQWNSIAANIRT